MKQNIKQIFVLIILLLFVTLIIVLLDTCGCVGVVQNRLFNTVKSLLKHESNPNSHSRCHALCPSNTVLEGAVQCIHICCVLSSGNGPVRSRCQTSLIKSAITRHQSNATIHLTCEPAW
jgi:hypothetical protein